MRKGMRLLGGAMMALALLGGSFVVPAHAVDDYPSWADVEAARASTAATAAEVDRIESLLSGLETRAAEAGDAAVVATAKAAAADAALAGATARAATLGTQLSTASAQADAAGEQLGRFGAHLYRSGAGDLVSRMLVTRQNRIDLLYQLGASTRLSEITRSVQQHALAARNVARTLEKQALAAATERDRLAGTARAESNDANRAQQTADEQLASQRVIADVLFAQLASLRNSTAETERAYRAGVLAEQEYRERQQSAGGSDPGDGSGSGGFTPPSGVVVDPAGARAYAADQVAARGWGTDQYDCLVRLWNRESGWRVDAYNASSGAYGIPQSLPGSKMQSAGDDWRTNAATQINWGLGYISSRYSSPCGAWQHSEDVNWY
ncbi:coiled-coil domain-containing protein [Luethyella okanaganae]|uniref:Coiled-coil domain-containing protein n=1 Tax=Luethyella okanaganae TaxID=69372 RepID=A0ABW1VAQ1_9MICO